jgi:hypothetical protein
MQVIGPVDRLAVPGEEEHQQIPPPGLGGYRRLDGIPRRLRSHQDLLREPAGAGQPVGDRRRVGFGIWGSWYCTPIAKLAGHPPAHGLPQK